MKVREQALMLTSLMSRPCVCGILCNHNLLLHTGLEGYRHRRASLFQIHPAVSENKVTVFW